MTVDGAETNLSSINSLPSTAYLNCLNTVQSQMLRLNKSSSTSLTMATSNENIAFITDGSMSTLNNENNEHLVNHMTRHRPFF